jgi:hypothetical protein
VAIATLDRLPAAVIVYLHRREGLSFLHLLLLFYPFILIPHTSFLEAYSTFPFIRTCMLLLVVVYLFPADCFLGILPVGFMVFFLVLLSSRPGFVPITLLQLYSPHVFPIWSHICYGT